MPPRQDFGQRDGQGYPGPDPSRCVPGRRTGARNSCCALRGRCTWGRHSGSSPLSVVRQEPEAPALALPVSAGAPDSGRPTTRHLERWHGTPLSRELRWDPISGREMDYLALRFSLTDGPFFGTRPVPESHILAHWEQCRLVGPRQDHGNPGPGDLLVPRTAPLSVGTQVDNGTWAGMPDGTRAGRGALAFSVGTQTVPEELGLHPAGLALDDVRIDLFKLEWWTPEAFRAQQARLNRPPHIVDHLWDQLVTCGRFRAWEAAGPRSAVPSVCLPDAGSTVALGQAADASADGHATPSPPTADSGVLQASVVLPGGPRVPDIAACADDFAYGGRVLVAGQPAQAVVVGGPLRYFLVVSPTGPIPYSVFLLRQWHECSDAALADLLPHLVDFPAEFTYTDSGRRVARWGPVIHLDAVCGILQGTLRAAARLRTLCAPEAYAAAVAAGDATPLDDVRAAWPIPEF